LIKTIKHIKEKKKLEAQGKNYQVDDILDKNIFYSFDVIEAQ
jgi:hypothetical protein